MIESYELGGLRFQESPLALRVRMPKIVSHGLDDGFVVMRWFDEDYAKIEKNHAHSKWQRQLPPEEMLRRGIVCEPWPNPLWFSAQPDHPAVPAINTSEFDVWFSSHPELYGNTPTEWRGWDPCGPNFRYPGQGNMGWRHRLKSLPPAALNTPPILHSCLRTRRRYDFKSNPRWRRARWKAKA